MIRHLLIVAGTLSLGAGIAGIFVPGLPATPFFLLTAGLYARSSETLYRRLLSNRFVGHYITSYSENPGLSVRAKVLTISLMWAMILFSVVFCLQSFIAKMIVALLGVAGTVVMGVVVPTRRNEGRDNSF